MGLQKSKTQLSDYNSNNNVACNTLGAGLRDRLFRHKSGLHHLFPDYACDISHNLGRLFYLSEYQVFISKTEIIIAPIYWGSWGFPGGSVGKESACNAGDTGR